MNIWTSFNPSCTKSKPFFHKICNDALNKLDFVFGFFIYEYFATKYFITSFPSCS